MRNEYSWRDGWALSYPHPLPAKPKPVKPESVTRCTYCGAWKLLATACTTCGTEST